MSILDYFNDNCELDDDCELDEDDLKYLDEVEESECKYRRKC